MRFLVKAIRRLLVGLLVVGLAVVGGAWATVRIASHGRITSDPAQAPDGDVVLVLGAAVWAHGPSPYLQGRLDVAAALYRLGKAQVIIVSGTRDGGYSEPDAMRTALVAAGVPPERIVADYAGDDTYSSCWRARHVYGVERLAVVSQLYHLPRAVAACRLVGLDAYGVGDDSIAHDSTWLRYQARELGGDIKLVWDALRRRSPADEADRVPSSAVADALAGA